MKTLVSALVLAILGFGSFAASADEEITADKYYLFIGNMDTLPISSMVANPIDAFDGYAKEMEQLGGKLHSYYWAVKDTTMYAIVSFPSHKEAAAQRYQRGSLNGLAKDIQMIEIFTSEQMVEVLEIAKKHDKYVQGRLKELKSE